MYRQFIEKTLQAASVIANDYFGAVSPSLKGGDPNQVLTEADLAVGREVARRIHLHYPAHGIIDEEEGYTPGRDGDSPVYTWVIDPIDGTSNFAAGTPFFGIMMGLLQGETPIAAGVILPALEELYIAERGCGAFRNGERISVSRERSLLSTLVAFGMDSHREEPELTYGETALLADIVLSCRNVRSSNSVFDQMMVACGAYGGCVNRSSMIWDNVAPALIIEEAGGIYTGFFGEPVTFPVDNERWRRPYTWCTAPAPLHRELQNIIQRKGRNVGHTDGR